ncbi:MAG: amino acid ABC transporter permease [Bacillaceae bacterium]|jgi:cystine transport system permease protein|uniref:Amino acid ABC transporter permease n=1 Tax=Aeribacillus composti TaxID=1868734 RepID=A0ABY9WCH6_9BACI|nr:MULTISPECIES: amino acid ABC transporter permease [Aeribacillus]AXI38339.1 amino acid ABC transporter permease [Bacillaceae bacterium ZC4]REJ17744.1 MAG: amino acid ABC transporter permease [Bacillaceae bacterium]MDR9792423.1 amino acid ABC transporter permease [Aeribacillus pallidus]MDR9798110.1 amino acid ABC transporter permease [Aeribacillus pallidus]MED0701388.1 amino acid ABC transporter permease [Aeribacillus composti]
MDLVIENLPFLLKGAYYTLLITVVSMFFGLIIGLIIAIARLKGNRILRGIARAYVSIIRGTPALVQIVIVYYGLVDYGIELGPLTAAYIALSINIGAYVSEAFRGAIQSIPKGQTEAALATGMTERQAMRRIIIPQAIRYAIPPLGNTFVGMLKETSLVSVIAVTELMRSAQLLVAQYYVYMPFYAAIAAMYWIMSTFFTFLLNKIEKRLSVY